MTIVTMIAGGVVGAAAGATIFSKRWGKYDTNFAFGEGLGVVIGGLGGAVVGMFVGAVGGELIS